MTENTLISKMLEMLRHREWSHRNAAENQYCMDCSTDDERWEDQYEHHEGCEFEEIVKLAEAKMREFYAAVEDGGEREHKTDEGKAYHGSG